MHPIFIDTEFSGLHQQAYLLSIALVPLEGPWFYAVFADADTEALRESKFHRENTLPNLVLIPRQQEALPPGTYVNGSRREVLIALTEYLAAFASPNPEEKTLAVWADVPAYDWVLFCELFGGAFGLPQHIHYVVRDLATLLEAKGYNIDTDRFALAYGQQGTAVGAVVSSADGRAGEGQAAAVTREGLLRHNALGDALACRACWRKLKNQ